MIDTELILIATWFSENYLILPPSSYYYGSSGRKRKYMIIYQEHDPKENHIRPKNFDVKNDSFVMSKDKLINYPKDFVFYMVIWMGLHIYNFNNQEITDELAMKYYLTTNRPLEPILSGFYESIAHQIPLTELNVRRVEWYKNKLVV